MVSVIVTDGDCGKERRMHTRECQVIRNRRKNQPEDIVEKPRSVAERAHDECQICSGEAPTGGRKPNGMEYQKMLSEMGPEDLGLSPMMEEAE